MNHEEHDDGYVIEYEEAEAYDAEINGNPSLANDHLAKLACYYEEIKDLQAYRDAELEKINAWYERVAAPFEKDIRYHEASLEYYFIGLPDNKRTIDLPNGKFGRRKVNTRLKVEDKKAVIAWAEAEGLKGLLDYKPQIIKAELDAHFKSSGEIPEGCEVEPEHDRYDFKPVLPSVNKLVHSLTESIDPGKLNRSTDETKETTT